MDSQKDNYSNSASSHETIPDGLYGELGGLAKDLNNMLMRQEDVESQVKAASEDLPLLSNQLLDVNRFTEEETHKILEYTEKVLDNHALIAARLRETKIMLSGEPLDRPGLEKKLGEMTGLVKENNKVLMDILTGLSFQDLAGQRMKRMDVILQDLQSRILRLVVTYGMEKRNEDKCVSKKRELLNELQSSTGVKLAQGEVNDILKEYGF
jgi:chemotaxis protein CheZ